MNKVPYIGRQISHFEAVEIDKITAAFSEDRRYRYRLSLPYRPEANRTKNAAIILKNPSSADINRADKTVQTAAKTIYMAFPEVKKLEILNIFAIRGTLPTDVMELHDAGIDIIGPENDTNFKEVLANSDYVITAWGGATPIKKSIYDKRVADVLAILNLPEVEAKVLRKAEKGSNQYPFHACYWPINDSFVEI